MKKSLTLFFLFFLAVHFCCTNLYALNFFRASKDKTYYSTTSAFNPMSSFENEEKADEKAPLFTWFTFDHCTTQFCFHIPADRICSNPHSSTLSVEPLYLVHKVIRI